MIHDLYLRAHIVVSGAQNEEERDYALVWDTETMLDLQQTLNFGVWRFCQIDGAEFVAVSGRDFLSRWFHQLAFDND